MSNTHSIRRQHGVSLVEVLVAVIVFAVGLLAIASLQGALVRTGNDAKARSVAVNLAEQRLEDMRSFVDGADFQGLADGSENLTGTDAVSGVEMTRSWTVQDYHYEPDGTTNTMQMATGTNASGRADAKRITVTVAWCDADSPAGCKPDDLTTDPETVSVTDVLAKAEPAGSAKSITELNIGDPPEVPYAPGDAPEVISIDLEDGTKKESPEPVIQTTRKRNEGTDSTEFSTITRFDAITFIPPPDGGDAVTVRRQEFLTVNCSCTLGDGSGNLVPTDEANYGRTPVFWDGAQYIGGVKVAKPVGTSTLDQSDASEIEFIEPLCNDCCRDHHDAPANTTFDHDGDEETPEISVDPYGPFREDGTVNNGDHPHYFPDNQDVLQPANSVGNDYLEACRFTRIDGALRVTHDFELESLQSLPGKDCTYDSATGECVDSDGDGVPDDSTNLSGSWVEAYRTYVTSFVEEFVTEASDGTVNYPGTKPTVTSADPSTLPTTDSVPTTGRAHELVSRGIFIDYMHQILRDRIDEQITKNNDDNEENDLPILAFAPFFEVNLQLQANWAVEEGNLVQVTSRPVDNEGYSRGFVTQNEAAAEFAKVFATIEQGNVGLTDSHDIYPIDLDGSGTVDRDELVRDFLAYGTDDGDGESRPIVSGTIDVEEQAKRNQLQPSDVVVTDEFDASCSTATGDEDFSCELLELDASGEIKVTNYSQFQGNNLQDNKVCLTPDGNTWYSGTVLNDGTADDTTVFSFESEDPPIDRTGYRLKVVSQSGGSLSCAPGQVN